MATERGDLIREDRVTVLGKDLDDLPQGRHSLAFILIAKALETGEPLRQALLRHILSINRLEGVMARMSSGRIWIRFSREAVGCGLTLETIGMHLISALKEEGDRFEKVEVILIVADQDLINKLRPLADKIADERHTRYHNALVEKMECETGLDCEECPESETCKILKDAVAVARKRNKSR
jgi:CO dehydrogenase/acetyl-CoA synthase beta subunit